MSPTFCHQDWAIESKAWFALVIAGSPFDTYLGNAPQWKLLKRDAAGALHERQRPAESRVSVTFGSGVRDGDEEGKRDEEGEGVHVFLRAVR